jgi:hypothetical protein
MARIRTIKPAFFLNEQVAGLPYQWRLLFVGLWTQADREGRLEDRPLRLKAALFPYDDLDINDGLESLHRVGLITRYERGNVRVIGIPTWLKHQQPHIREAISELPGPDPSTEQARDEPPRKGREGNGDQEGVRITLTLFERFWSVYPRKTAKDAARKEFIRIGADEAKTDAMIAKVNAYKASPQWTKDGGQYVPHARTWLHQKRWEDEVDGPASPTAPRDDSARKRYGSMRFGA